MTIELLYIVAAMILFDLFGHIGATIGGGAQKAWNKWYFWPPAKIFGIKRENVRFYNYFWTSYWTLAFVLTVLAIVL